MSSGRLLVGLAVALLAVSCRTPAPLSSPQPLATGDPRPVAWMASLARSAESRQALRAHSRLALDSPDLRFRRPQRLLVQRPAGLRVEVFGLFGQVAAVLVTDGQQFEWLDASRGEVEQGVVDDQLLWRLARIDLSPGEAVAVLLGVPLPREGLERRPGRSRGEGRIEVPFGRAGGSEQVFFLRRTGSAGRSRDPRRIRRRALGGELQRVQGHWGHGVRPRGVARISRCRGALFDSLRFGRTESRSLERCIRATNGPIRVLAGAFGEAPSHFPGCKFELREAASAPCDPKACCVPSRWLCS